MLLWLDCVDPSAREEWVDRACDVLIASGPVPQVYPAMNALGDISKICS